MKIRLILLFSLCLGLIMTRASFMYVTNDYGQHRSILPGPSIQIPLSDPTIELNEWNRTNPHQQRGCTAVMIENHWELPFVAMSEYGNSGCGGPKYLEISGLIVDSLIYSLVLSPFVALVVKRRAKQTSHQNESK